MKKLISLLLALVLLVSMIPMVVGADGLKLTDYKEFGTNADGTGYYGIKNDGSKVTLTENEYKELEDQFNKLIQRNDDVHEPGKHKYGIQYNTKYHWLGCACGCKISMERHVDPKDAPDDTCTCGYKFSNNADLVTLWVDGCPGIEDFNKNTTEYTLKAYTYKDVKKIRIATRTHDSESTVELPEDLTLKEGTNVFPVKVIAENQKDTKTYTLTIIKESKK